MPSQVVVCTKTSNTMPSRPSGNYYQPTLWSHEFIDSLKTYQYDKVPRQKQNNMKEIIEAMVSDEDINLLKKLELIDDIERLGVGYHFKDDIRREIGRIVSPENYKSIRMMKNLHATALCFRLGRQHGFEVSEDVFQDFMDHEGDFIVSTCNEVKGLLSLYESSYLAFEGESILEKAKTYTIAHLNEIKQDSEINITEQINHAMELPLQRRMPRLEARWNIEEYKKRKYINPLLLEFAKLDYNMVQSSLQGELQELSRWWKDIGLASKLSFARDRIMECFFWAVGIAFEPQFWKCRKSLTKVAALVTTIDDVYDVYGSLEELEIFTSVVDRWDINEVGTLPDYMKLCFVALYNTVNEIAYDILKEHGINTIPYMKTAWGDLCKAFQVEAKWKFNQSTPKFKAYLDNGWVSASGVIIFVHSYFNLCENIKKEALQVLCMKDHRDLLQSSSTIFRLCNDLATSAAEVQRGENANSVLCFMQENNVSENSARKHINDIIDEEWRKINKYQVFNSSLLEPFAEIAINMARISHCIYSDGDGHGAPNTKSKIKVSLVMLEPIN